MNPEAEGKSMVTDVLRRYADQTGLAYDGPRGATTSESQAKRGAVRLNP